MHEAQVLRGFEHGERFERIKSLGYLVGSTIDRAFDRSVTVYEAMTLRGFGGGLVIRSAGFKRSDVFLASILVMTILFVTFFLPNILAVIFI